MRNIINILELLIEKSIDIFCILLFLIYVIIYEFFLNLVQLIRILLCWFVDYTFIFNLIMNIDNFRLNLCIFCGRLRSLLISDREELNARVYYNKLKDTHIIE